METPNNTVVMDGQGNDVDIPITNEQVGREFNIVVRYDYDIIKAAQNTGTIVHRNERSPISFKTIRGFAKILADIIFKFSNKKEDIK